MMMTNDEINDAGSCVHSYGFSDSAHDSHWIKEIRKRRAKAKARLAKV
jgi:hypothetical protein